MPTVEKDKDVVVLNIAHRERDHVILGEDGLRALKLMISIARREHKKTLRKLDKGKLNEWSDLLSFEDKYIEKLFQSARKVVVEVDWDKWADLEKELTTENRRLNR